MKYRRFHHFHAFALSGLILATPACEPDKSASGERPAECSDSALADCPPPANPDGGMNEVDGGVDPTCDPLVECPDQACGAVSDGCGEMLDCGACVQGTNFVSYVGCSQTRDNTDGYEQLGGTRLESWASGGCSIDRWLDASNECWSDYEKSVQGKTPEAGYFQICIRTSDPVTYENVLSVTEMFRDKLPAGAAIYVSGLEIFEPDDLCNLATGEVQQQTRDYADQLAADGHAIRAPDLGPLTPENTMEDNCHPGPDGRLLTGQQLIDFFGAGQ